MTITDPITGITLRGGLDPDREPEPDPRAIARSLRGLEERTDPEGLTDLAEGAPGNRVDRLEPDPVVDMLAGFDLPDVTEAHAVYRAALEKHASAADDLRAARRARQAAEDKHARAVREAVRADKKPPKPATFPDLDAAIRDAETVARERSNVVREKAAAARTVAARHYPDLRATVLARLDESQAVAAHALDKLSAALSARDELRGVVATLDAEHARRYATTVLGMKAPKTGDGRSIDQAATGLRQANRGNSARHLLDQLRDQAKRDDAIRNLIEQDGPDHYIDHRPGDDGEQPPAA